MNNEEIISVQVEKNNIEFIEHLDSKQLDYEKLDTSSFDGQSEVVTLIMTLTPIVIPVLGKIVSEHIKSKRHVKIIYKGVQLQGINEKNARKIIESISKTKN